MTDPSDSNSALIEVTAYAPEQGRWYCDHLERGKILFFRGIPFELPEDDTRFLLTHGNSASRIHKNISYRPANDAVKGSDLSGTDHDRLREVMRAFSREVTAFIHRFLPPYAGKIKLDYASFRSMQEAGRKLSLHKRNDLLHVDAFPTRPTKGARILRVFLNIHPSMSRIWKVGAPFHEFFPRLAQEQKISPPPRPAIVAAISAFARHLGLPLAARSRYDEFMLYLHNWLKENTDFQKDSSNQELEFPPGCCWMVYTDGVPHAVLSGQFALEQTFIVPLEALVSPEVAPVRVLESTAGLPMAS
jgi:3-deoxy-D-manno-oct-2-ulosonic acid (Kdo) hydroxylase